MTKKPHYGWAVCFTCVVVLFCSMGISNTAFPAHLPAVRAADGLTNAQCSTILMVRNLTSLVCMFFVDRYLEIFHVKKGILIALATVAVSFVMYSFSHTFFAYCASALVSGAGYSFGGMIPVSLLLNRWFLTGRTFAIGLCSAGTGVASIVLPPAITKLSERFSLPATFRMEAALIFAVALIAALVIRDDPSEMGLEPVSGGKEDKARSLRADVTTTSASLAFACMSGLFLAFAIYGTYPFIALHLTTQGMSPIAAASYTALFGITLTLGKLIYGFLVDKLGVLRVTMFFFACEMFGIFAMTGAARRIDGAALMICILIWGNGNAISTVMHPAMASELSSRADFTKVLKRIQISYTLGSVLIGPIPGMIADKTGSYVPAYALFGCVMACGMLFAFCSLRLRERQLTSA